jgi:uncharacterized membrane protein YdbT with pleckstrin-like domain
MNPTTPSTNTPNPPTPNLPKGIKELIVLQDGERVLCIIKRHPIGILGTYLAALMAILLLAVLAALFAPKLIDAYSTTMPDIAALLYTGMALLGAFLVLVLTVATYVYWQNIWIVTGDSVTQVSQRGLFSREVSQVPMQNLEDVTVDQDGIFPSMFSYGILKIESAGERSKFQFPYCPNPNDYAHTILEAHEEFAKSHRMGGVHHDE